MIEPLKINPSYALAQINKSILIDRAGTFSSKPS